MILNGVMAVTLRYFTKFLNLFSKKLPRRSVAEYMHETIVFCTACRRSL